MNENPLISIIVPVYNVEKHLSKCIESIIDQTYSNLEIILIDDGSTDNSGKICDKYAVNDERIKIIHKENSGVSKARNLGINSAHGEYISFVDSDDYVDKDYIRDMFLQVKQDGTQLSICNMMIDKNGKYSVRYSYDLNGVYSSEEILKKILNFEMTSSAWGKLLKKDLLNDVRFENYVIAEDLLFITKVLSKVKKVSVNNHYLYFYVLVASSAIHSGFKYSKYESLQVYNKIIKITENTSCYDYAVGRCVSGNFNVLLKMPKNKYKEEYNKICNTIKKYRKMIISNRKIRFKTRVACLISFCGFNILKLIFNILKYKKL